ncbi:hypothetical protein NW768_008436 [Fusarium equiseti]|uniref:C2H2-type domain-containing protein n=1 Tax=Fusarium equiseti TaxID=61235 RepID=A0ABQ8R715_FUSEQ|nr:hypothetical protein NW768_008436 [Fusarium equiseti]
MVGGGEVALVIEKGAKLVMGELLMPQEVLLAATPTLARTPITGLRLSSRRTPMLIVKTLLFSIDRSNLPVALGTCDRMLLSVVTKQQASVDEMLGALPTSEVEALDFFVRESGQLEIHQATVHRGEKTYTCPECDQAFGQESTRDAHKYGLTQEECKLGVGSMSRRPDMVRRDPMAPPISTGWCIYGKIRGLKLQKLTATMEEIRFHILDR